MVRERYEDDVFGRGIMSADIDMENENSVVMITE